MEYIIKINGYIKPFKVKELQLTFKQATSLTPPGCTDLQISANLMETNRYHFWASIEKGDDLEVFLESESFQLMLGAFKVLGFITDISFSENQFIHPISFE